MATAVYIRVSTDQQNLEVQREEIQKWLDGHQIKDATWFEDKSTGTNTDRPGFADLQKAVFNGGIDTIVVWKLDRISRSLSDGIQIICNWLDKNIRLIATTQQMDFNGAHGKMIASILVGVAEMEISNLKERQSAGIAAAKKKGKYTGRKKGTTKVDPQKVRDFFWKWAQDNLQHSEWIDGAWVYSRPTVDQIKAMEHHNASPPIWYFGNPAFRKAAAEKFKVKSTTTIYNLMKKTAPEWTPIRLLKGDEYFATRKKNYGE